MNSFRHLTKKEITLLEKQRCTADNWNQVVVHEPFTAGRIINVRFSGAVSLQPFRKIFIMGDGREVPAGLYNTTIHHCEIGRDAHISDVRDGLSNYRIGENVFIRDADSIAVENESTFGNGTEVHVLDETGGRSVKIVDGLSAHLAYMLAMYRHRPGLTRAIYHMIDRYTGKVRSAMGYIGKHSRILHAGTIRNVNIGPWCTIEGSRYLYEGTIHSSKSDPVFVGPGVTMKHFILSEGGHIANDVILDHCFVGHACEMGKQFSAEHSLFFSNCIAYHGEACSIFAGPYTVTHHKSTLLIAGMFSFFNAGSGTNQSNHMYKLGPVHHGVMERGSKTASDSYILWPAKVGAFTVVMGRHYKNSDTSSLPFSYLIENNDESFLSPGVNLRSVGTIRDARKWPARDKRNCPATADFINFNLLSPYTINKVIAGRDLLKRLLEYSGEKSEFYSYENVKITRSALLRGIQLYNIALYKFLGNSLIQQLTSKPFRDIDGMRKVLIPESKTGKGKWTDLAGLIAPLNEIETLADNIENGKIKNMQKIRDVFRDFHARYYTWTWNWAADILEKETGKKISTWTIEDVCNVVNKWKESVTELDKMLYEDAKKEFTLISQTGFGIDGDKNTRTLDFEQVRGKFEENPQVKSIQEHLKKKNALSDRIIGKLMKLSTFAGKPA
ncbi:MAG: DUF4954 family protein [Bacteroidales bacterium]|nr:DUF4954 family protein [Bacteroidales bacterium]